MGAVLQNIWNKYVWDSSRGVNFENPKTPINADTIDQWFDGPASKSGKSVNADNALTLSAVWRAIAVLTGAASSMPWKVYKKTSKGREEVSINEHPAIALLRRKPNNKVTSAVWVDRVVNHIHMRGNHYAFIYRNDFREAVELEMWNPDTVEVLEDASEVYYKRKGSDKIYQSRDVIHVPHLGSGIVGKSTISYAKEDMGLEMSRRDYGSSVYANGAKPPALLKPTQPMDEPKRAQAQKAWKEMKQGGGDVLMPFGMDYQSLAMKPEEVEFLQAGNFSVATIARWFGVPPHKLYDLDRATFSNIEHMGIEFTQDSMDPTLVKIEAEYNTKLFQLPVEIKRGYYTEFNRNAYVRTDLLTRTQAYAAQIHSAQLTPAEARTMENKPFMEGSDQLFINQGSAPISLLNEILLKKQPVSATAREKLKAKFNGQTQEILDILND
jgi:HK97 family phage portal protein